MIFLILTTTFFLLLSTPPSNWMAHANTLPTPTSESTTATTATTKVTTTTTTPTSTTATSTTTPTTPTTTPTIATTTLNAITSTSTATTLTTTTTTTTTKSAETTPATTTTAPNTTATTTQTTTQATDLFSFQSVINLLGHRKAVDVVFLMGRNIEIGKRNFYQGGRRLSMALLKQYASVHEDFARVAYVTFAGNSSVDYDDISGSNVPRDKCQMFPSVQQDTPPLDSVAYINEQEDSVQGIDGAIQKANDIFQAGKIKRPTATQILFFVTDANFYTSVPTDPSVSIYGIGIGASYIDTAMKGLVKDANNYAFIKDWFDMTDTFLPPVKFSNPLHVDSVPQDQCLSLQSALNADNTHCFCDVDYGVVRLQCKAGFKDVLDEATTTPVGPEYGRSCINESIFVASCSPNTCNLDFCTKKFDGSCVNNVINCQRKCSNGATCRKMADGYFCRCIGGFYGPNCQYKEDDCSFSGICLNNSTCIDDGVQDANFKCNCTGGLGGDFCQDIPSTPAPTPVPKAVVDSLDMKASTIAGIVIGAFFLLVILVGLIVLIALCLRQRARNKRNYTKRSEMGTSTEASGSVSKWSVKNRNNLSVRLSELWKHRSLRGLKTNDGMPSVPWKKHMKLSEMDMQNVSQEEAIFENELIHDNRPVVENWTQYMLKLVERNIIKKGLMVNVFTKDIVNTDDWEFNWSEVYTLDTVFGTDTNVNVQEEDYYLKAPEDGVASGRSGSQYTNDKQTLLAVAKTKKYLIAAVVALSDSQDGSQCLKEVRMIMNHVKAEGY